MSEVNLGRSKTPLDEALAYLRDPRGNRPWKDDHPWAVEAAERIVAAPDVRGAARWLTTFPQWFHGETAAREAAEIVRLMLGVDPVLKPKYQSVSCPACGAERGTRCGSTRTPEGWSWWCSGRDRVARRAGIYRRSRDRVASN